MGKKRLIFTLIYSDDFFMQSRNFRLQKVGDIKWLDKNYQFQKIAFALDELIILNASRQQKSIEKFAKTVDQLRQNVFIPVAAGGGIRTIEDARMLFQHGADKIVINSILLKQPNLVRELVQYFGSQSIVASVDYKKEKQDKAIYIHDGQEKTDIVLNDYLKHIETLNIGEIYLNSIDKDGTGFGYDIETIDEIKNSIYTPLIIAGGAGNENHLISGLKIDSVNAVATANLFNFIGNSIPLARKKIIENGIQLAEWSE